MVYFIFFSEDDIVNPMVAGFQDELDPEDIVTNLADTSIHDNQEVHSDQNSDTEEKNSNIELEIGMYNAYNFVS